MPTRILVSPALEGSGSVCQVQTPLSVRYTIATKHADRQSLTGARDKECLLVRPGTGQAAALGGM